MNDDGFYTKPGRKAVYEGRKYDDVFGGGRIRMDMKESVSVCVFVSLSRYSRVNGSASMYNLFRP